MSIPLSFALFSKKRSINTFFSLILVFFGVGSDLLGQCPLFTNEIHYDNGAPMDANERIEIGGEVGTSLTGWSLVFYNGTGGTTYATVNLSTIAASMPATTACTVSGVNLSFITVDVVAATGLSFQNGFSTDGDGWALVNGSTVVELYSYEGTFTATNGPANGMQSTDIGVFEDGTGASTGSIQRTSTSTWTVDASNNTFGACNTSQYGPPCGSNPIVTLSLSAIEGSEANTTVVTATANATAPVSGAQTVTLAITGTNITGGDYNLTNTTITIPNGATSGSVTFTVVNDAVAENAELAVFTISNPSAGITLGATVSRNLIIYDNDAPLATRCLVSSNEIHYDNASTDANERIEIAGDATTSLTGWSIILYQQDGTVYGSANLTGTIPNTGTCTVSGRTIGLVSLDIPALTGQSLQGGPSDGWALAYNSTIVEFFSYEGTILATEGPALGLTSVDIGASEDGTGTSSGSIQRTGPNTWVTSATSNTFGACNSPQYVSPCSTIPSVDLTLNVYEGTENAGTVVQVIATTNIAVTGNQTVNLTITGTNVTGSDYTISNLVITIPNGTNTGTVTFTVLNDALFENVETVNFSISNPSAGLQLGFLTSQNFIIYDNDIPPFVECEIYSNEIHYDNTGTDVNENIELIGEVGASLDDWQVILYDNTGNPYGNPINLTGTIPNTNSCMVGDRLLAPFVIDVPTLAGSSIMGGPSDGWALVHSGNLVEFWSYEGTINAVSGPAIGMTSTNIGASEDGTGQTTGSIQRSDTLTWVTSTTTNTFGACNTTQYSKPCLQYMLSCPADSTVSICLSQSAVDAAFATWLGRFTATGGTNGVLSNNSTVAPNACGGSVTITFYYVFDELPAGDSCMATFTVPNSPPVTLICPTNTTVAACQTQAAVNAQFAAWLATVSGSGGCNGVLTDNNTGAPAACGGSTTVTFTYTSSCAPITTTCQATFTVSAPPTVSIICANDTMVAACQTQIAVDAAFATWLTTASGSGGCNGVLTNNSVGAPPACGGSTTVIFTYTSACAPLTTTCEATFTVSAPPAVSIICANDTLVAACQTQTAVDAAFATWLTTASGSGGCNGALTNNNTGAPSACGGSTTVTFTYSSSCAPTTTTCQATFTVLASPVILICPTNMTTGACQTQAAVNAEFATFLATASGSGGCNGTLTNNNTGAPPACGGSTTVTFTYTSSCAPITTTCQATFTVSASTVPLTYTCPADTMLGTNPDSIIVNSMPVVTSSCGTPTIMVVDGPISRDGCFMSYIKTFTVSDACNESTTCTQTISWLDSLTIDVRFEGPLEACEGDDSTYLIITEISGGTPPYTIDYGDIIIRRDPTTCIEIGVGGTFMQTTDSQIDTVIYQGLTPGNYTLEVLGVSDENGCTGDPDTSVSFVIYPLPVGVDTAYEIESCITDSLVLDSLIQCSVPSTFEWYSVEAVGSDVPFDNPNVVGETVMPARSGSTITDIITNITLDTQTIIYYVVPTSITGGCEGAPFYISKSLLPFELSWSAVDEVNFSLDANCMGLITPSTLLTGANICDALFTIEIQYPEGSNSYEPANKVDETHVGKCLQVSVIDIITGNSTWGTVCIEDKFGPTITGVPDTCIYCIEGILPSRTGQATATDCGGVEEIWYKDITQDYECNENSDTASVITRVWYARDGLNNIAIDTQIITLKNLPDSLLRQPDVLVELACGQGTSPADIARLKGIPAAYAHYINPVTGLATPILEGGVCNFVAGYEDSKKLDACGPECGSSYKFVRTWTVLNWCTRTTRKFSQLIKVTDSIAPNIAIAIPAKEYSVTAWECAVTIDMPSAIVTDNCDDHAELVAIDGPIGSTVRKINGIWRAYDVPKGIHEFIYTATDCCGNLSTASVTITVVDKIGPVASAKEYITVSLTRSGVEEEDGIAKITPEMIDNNSYDNCSDVYLEVRRDDASPVCLNEGDLWNHDNNASTPMVRWNNNTTYNGTINGRDELNPIHEHDRIYDTDKGQYVKVCCEDIGQEVKVWLRVWDDADMDGIFGSAGDNYNETWAILKVEDKIVPTLVCERDITTYCDRADVKLSLGKWTDVAGNVPASYLPWIDGVCKDYSLEYRDEGFITTCNTTLREQPIIRTYRIKGTNVTCTVNVYILDVETEPKLDWPINLHTWTKCTLTEEDVLNNTIKAVGLRSVMVAGIEGTSQIVLEDYYTYVPYYWREWLGTDYNTPNLGLYCFDSGTTEIADPKNGTNGLTPIGGGLTSDLENKTRFNPNWRDIGCKVFGRKIIIDEYNVGEGCKKWIVRFEYIDWCNPEWAACVSTIYKYEDETPPTIEVSMSDTIAIDANCVTGWMTSPKGLDDGGCEAGYRWVVTIQTGGAGLVQTGIGRNPKLTFNNVPVGKWTVHYKLTDGCGNVTEKEAMLLVLGKAPTPYCISLSSAVMKNGTVELWARDFDKNSFDNCIDGPLYFTFDNQHPVLSKLAQVHYFKGAGLDAKESEYLTGAAQKWIPDLKETKWPNGEIKVEVTGGTSGRLFGCNVGDGSTFPVANVKMTVWDRDLLSDFCEVTLTLIDNQGACGPTSQVVISGKVTIESGAGLANAEMILESALPEYPKKTRTNEAGAYTFGGVPVGVDYAVKANLDENYKNGVNTLDLVHIQRHILSLKKLTSPYKMIAADASGDAAIRVEDLVALRKLILGVADDLPGNTSWRFVDASQEMGETPWPFNEVMSHASIKEGSVDNFIAVKIGDVDGSAKTGLKGENEVTPRNSGVTLSTEDRMVKKGEMVEVQLSADQFNDIYGFQMAMKLKGLTLISAEGRGIEIGNDNYATPMSNVMTMSWSSANAKSVSEGSIVMTIRFKATQDGQLSKMIEVSNDILRSEAYVGSNIEPSAIALEVRRNARPSVLHLSQNEPNPWRGETVVNYELPKAGKVTLTVLDITGKMVAQKTVDGATGKNTINLTKAELGGAAGVMIYRLESGGLSTQKKMIVIE